MFSSTVHTSVGSVAPRTMVVKVTPRCNLVTVRVSLRPDGPRGREAAAGVPGGLAGRGSAVAGLVPIVSDAISTVTEPATRHLVIQVIAPTLWPQPGPPKGSTLAIVELKAAATAGGRPDR